MQIYSPLSCAHFKVKYRLPLALAYSSMFWCLDKASKIAITIEYGSLLPTNFTEALPMPNLKSTEDVNGLATIILDLGVARM